MVPTKTLPSRAPSLYGNNGESGAKDLKILVWIIIIFPSLPRNEAILLDL